jgi:3-oxoacyl-[acyl-carrier protein] reductase
VAKDSLTGKVAIVTGASRGIGRAVALALAENGAWVALAARTEAALHALRREIESGGGRALAAATDITSEPQVKELVRSTVEQFGRLDILINNAGVGYYAPLVETTVEQWEQMMAVNARGPFLLCREAIPHMERGGFIINIASVVGVKGYVKQAAYTASKHALMGMTKVLAQEVQPAGIRVHAICPGGVDTDLVRQARPDLDSSVLMEPEEIADIILFLLTRRGNAVIDDIHVRRAASDPWF